MTSRGFHTVIATVVTGADSASASRRIRLDPDPLACSAHLVNRGLEFRTGGTVVAEFAGVGPVDSFTCTLNGDVVTESCEGVCSNGDRFTCTLNGDVVTESCEGVCSNGDRFRDGSRLVNETLNKTSKVSLIQMY